MLDTRKISGAYHIGVYGETFPIDVRGGVQLSVQWMAVDGLGAAVATLYRAPSPSGPFTAFSPTKTLTSSTTAQYDINVYSDQYIVLQITTVHATTTALAWVDAVVTSDPGQPSMGSAFIPPRA